MITYRSKYRYENCYRCIDADSVKVFDSIACGSTYNNIDYTSGRVLMAPHSFDPVLYGVRGDCVDILKQALKIIKVCEPLTAWTLFRTNQHTDAHALLRRVGELRAYKTATIKIRITAKPVTIAGGHVIVKGGDGSGSIDLIFFKPSGLTDVARKLEIGDEVYVQGHVKPWRGEPYFHVEKIFVFRLARSYICRSPLCPVCGKRMTKKGFGKGYSCTNCGYKSTLIVPECIGIDREVGPGIYMPPHSEQKHLIKPVERYGKEKLCHPKPATIPVEHVTAIIEPLQFL